MKKTTVVTTILGKKSNKLPDQDVASVFAPTNIALCKYWGKRDSELNLPVTSSFSLSLGKKGTKTELKVSDTAYDVILLNNKEVDSSSEFYKRLAAFLDLFPVHRAMRFYVNTQSNIPTAAGLASSASGFAAIVMALNQLFCWGLSYQKLSILARLGSGSACRSIWQGFVEWHAGTQNNGMDSYGEPFPHTWPELCMGLCIVSTKEKYISSREAMKRTIETSPFFAEWPNKVNMDLPILKQAIINKDFHLFGKVSESNAMSMHATMLSAWPPIHYAVPETILIMKKVWELRQQGLPLYFTQDAGPNLKLLFLEKDKEQIQQYFTSIEILQPFLE
jgi:diphosphomevalonate decarboxylase